MSTTIEKITKASQKGYIADIAAIGRIVTRLASLPVAVFQSKSTEPLLGVVSDYLMDCEMDKSRYLQVSYGEMLGIIELIPSTRIYCSSFGEEYCRNMRLTLLAHVRNLLMEFDSKNDTVHLFMSMTVSGYFRYLISKSGNGTKRIYRSFIRSVKRNTKIEISDDTTIKQFLNSMYSFQIQNWVPSIPIDEFEKEIRGSYEDLYSFFITHFKEAFPECFDLKKLKGKYNKTEE